MVSSEPNAGPVLRRSLSVPWVCSIKPEFAKCSIVWCRGVIGSCINSDFRAKGQCIILAAFVCLLALRGPSRRCPSNSGLCPIIPLSSQVHYSKEKGTLPFKFQTIPHGHKPCPGAPQKAQSPRFRHRIAIEMHSSKQSVRPSHSHIRRLHRGDQIVPCYQARRCPPGDRGSLCLSVPRRPGGNRQRPGCRGDRVLSGSGKEEKSWREQRGSSCPWGRGGHSVQPD